MATPITRLLGQNAFLAADCSAALGGQGLPQNLGNRVARLCVVNGIRNHVQFARSAEVEELCHTKGQEIFARARNANLIQNDRIPDSGSMANSSWHPYCIWYPRVASEDTYRRLAAAFPEMRYQVGRACAVAGYSKLYNELELLPDPSIAEEARENLNTSVAAGAQRIYNQIMATPVFYGVMNDYERTVQLDKPLPGAYLNADTAVVETLKQRKKFEECFASPWRYFNLTEDRGIGETTVAIEPHKLTEDEASLLNLPLPANLPTMRKDLMILVAAFEGNLDRYARLRRPNHAVNHELHCVLQGVHKSTALAHWLERNPDIIRAIEEEWVSGKPSPLRKAISARKIMNNSIHHILNADPPVPDDELPYWIWYPTIPDGWALHKLAEARPAMREQCARACIAGSKQHTYTLIMDMLDENGKPTVANRALWDEAQKCAHSEYFEADIIERRKKQGLNTSPRSLDGWNEKWWQSNMPWREADSSRAVVLSALEDSSQDIIYEDSSEPDWAVYDGIGVSLGLVRLYLSSTPEMRQLAAKDGVCYWLADSDERHYLEDIDDTGDWGIGTQ